MSQGVSDYSIVVKHLSAVSGTWNTASGVASWNSVLNDQIGGTLLGESFAGVYFFYGVMVGELSTFTGTHDRTCSDCLLYSQCEIS